ncbi:hypothetical protein SA13_0830 [Salmonella enterica subsp. enterica serovar Agona str. 13.E.05]|nr:hypothetical protein SA13_0830 [Salmonella enterica subsp. enterica serovar Agona str. 13.E.05]
MFPAPAGINRKIVLNDSPRGRVPRASGDKPQEWLETVVKPQGRQEIPRVPRASGDKPFYNDTKTRQL